MKNGSMMTESRLLAWRPSMYRVIMRWKADFLFSDVRREKSKSWMSGGVPGSSGCTCSKKVWRGSLHKPTYTVVFALQDDYRLHDSRFLLFHLIITEAVHSPTAILYLPLMNVTCCGAHSASNCKNYNFYRIMSAFSEAGPLEAFPQLKHEWRW